MSHKIWQKLKTRDSTSSSSTSCAEENLWITVFSMSKKNIFYTRWSETKNFLPVQQTQFLVVRRQRIWRFAFYWLVLILHKTTADNMSLHGRRIFAYLDKREKSFQEQLAQKKRCLQGQFDLTGLKYGLHSKIQNFYGLNGVKALLSI